MTATITKHDAINAIWAIMFDTASNALADTDELSLAASDAIAIGRMLIHAIKTNDIDGIEDMVRAHWPSAAADMVNIAHRWTTISNLIS